MSQKEALAQLEAVQKASKKIEEAFEQISSSDFDDLNAHLSCIESAKLNISMAFGIASVYYALTRTQGSCNDTGKRSEHPIQLELTRIKEYVARIQKIEKDLEQKQALTLDKGAATRMIMHSLRDEEETVTMSETTVTSAEVEPTGRIGEINPPKKKKKKSDH